MSKSTGLFIGVAIVAIATCFVCFRTGRGSPPVAVPPAAKVNGAAGGGAKECILLVSLDQKEIRIQKDATIQVTIDAVKDLPEGGRLTEYAIGKIQLTWFSDDGRISPRSGYGRNPTGEDAKSPTVKLPITRKFEVMSVFSSGPEDRVLPGVYQVQASILGPELKFVSEPIAVTLIQPPADGSAK